MATLWVFEPLDTFFARDGQPFNAGESFAAASQFPPSPLTLQGAVRTAVLHQMGVDPVRFAQAAREGRWEEPELIEARRVVGEPDQPGLRFAGPFLLQGDQLYYPAPLDLYRTGKSYGLLAPGDPIECDLGKVRLPTGRGPGLKSQAGKWLPGVALEQLLAGRPSVQGDLVKVLDSDAGAERSLAVREHRIGLAREATRTVREGHLYSSVHIRLHDQVRIGVVVDGLPADLTPAAPFVQTLGGEQRQARVTVREAPAWPSMPELRRDEHGWFRLKLVFVTPVLFGQGSWLPDGFTAREAEDGSLCWSGSLEGVPLDILSACIGKPVRIGGWDLARGCPRPLVSYLPTGTVFFCRTRALPAETARLHGRQVGECTAFGFGLVLAGTW